MARADAIGIACADLAASLDFYRRVGLPIPEDASADDHVEAQLPGGFRVMFDSVDVIKSFDPEWEQPTGRGRIGIAFACDSPAEVDATYADLVGAGYRGHKEPWDAFWGHRYAQVLDPDGNTVDLFAPLS
jgi:catechol 2,3-dioxygenase-like lactoylglutathione lyase family enzyme